MVLLEALLKKKPYLLQGKWKNRNLKFFFEKEPLPKLKMLLTKSFLCYLFGFHAPFLPKGKQVIPEII